MHGVHHRDRQAADRQRAAVVHRPVFCSPLLSSHSADLVRRDDVRAGGARDRHRVGGVIAVPVRDQHQIERADLLRRLRRTTDCGDHGSSRMRLPPGDRSRNVAWPSQVNDSVCIE